jgi:Protein of unknown function (DUF3040)
MLTEHERRLLDELEAQLEADDPRLAGLLQVSPAPARPRIRLLVAMLLGVVGFAVAVLGLLETNAVVGVAGLLLAGAGACIGAESAGAEV